MPCSSQGRRRRGRIIAVADGQWVGGYTTRTVHDGQWHHLAGVFSGTSGAIVTPAQLTVYIDGEPAPLVTIAFGQPAAPLAGGGPTMIGWHEAAGQWFQGSLDEVAVAPGRWR